MTLIITIPFTGSNFLVHFLGCVLGLDGASGIGNTTVGFVQKGSNSDFCQVHPNKAQLEGMLPYVLSDHFDSAIVTLRHPYKTALSFKNNGLATSELNEYWATLDDEASRYDNVLSLAIDGPEQNRLSELQAIANHFQSDRSVDAFAKDWAPRHVTGRRDAELTEEDKAILSPSMELYEKWRK